MRIATIIAAFVVVAALAMAASRLDYKNTPIIPGTSWHVHDLDRPQPRVVTPGAFSTQDTPGRPPSDAIMLFDGQDLAKWRGAKGPAAWKIENGYMEAVPKKGDLFSNEEFGDIQLHIEWATPNPPKGNSQARGNSGIFLMGRYEVQVLDSFQNRTYADGAAASLYGQCPPLVNAMLPPGQWQVYDLVFIAPRFKGGKLESPACVTLFHNGVLIHNHTPMIGISAHKVLPKWIPHGPTGPIKLQEHGNPVRFRNIWVRPLKGYDQP